jgi:serine/threonine protein kinase
VAGEPPTIAGGPELEFGHYTVLRRADGSAWKLGAGGMGVTYKAMDAMLHRPVAVKVIAPARWHEPRTRALFLREARAAARVRHENVASVVYLGDESKNFFMVIEFVDGVCLDERLRGNGPVAPLLAVELATQVARGLAAIHEQQIVHRDLKPSNLMLVPTARGRATAADDPAGWQAKIIDFGLARSFTASGLGTQAGALTRGFVGTAAYASPEQCAEQDRIDGRSDLYSLGCILWEMLAGAPPFLAATQREMLNQHIGRPPPLARMMWLPPSLVRILERLLAKEPDDRFANASATAWALKDCRERLVSGAECVDEGKRPKPDPENPIEPTWTTTSAHAGPGPGSLLPLLGLAAVVSVVMGAWFVGLRVYEMREAPPPPRSSQPLESRKSIAMLPFASFGEEAKSDPFASALQQDILASLARIRDLKVVARNLALMDKPGSRDLRQIGLDLGAGALLEGSVRRVGTRVRVAVHLVDPATGQSLWAENFDREVTDVREVPELIARGVAGALGLELDAP